MSRKGNGPAGYREVADMSHSRASTGMSKLTSATMQSEMTRVFSSFFLVPISDVVT